MFLKGWKLRVSMFTVGCMSLIFGYYLAGAILLLIYSFLIYNMLKNIKNGDI